MLMSKSSFRMSMLIVTGESQRPNSSLSLRSSCPIHRHSRNSRNDLCKRNISYGCLIVCQSKNASCDKVETIKKTRFFLMIKRKVVVFYSKQLNTSKILEVAIAKANQSVETPMNSRIDIITGQYMTYFFQYYWRSNQFQQVQGKSKLFGEVSSISPVFNFCLNMISQFLVVCDHIKKRVILSDECLSFSLRNQTHSTQIVGSVSEEVDCLVLRIFLEVGVEFALFADSHPTKRNFAVNGLLNNVVERVGSFIVSHRISNEVLEIVVDSTNFQEFAAEQIVGARHHNQVESICLELVKHIGDSLHHIDPPQDIFDIAHADPVGFVGLQDLLGPVGRVGIVGGLPLCFGVLHEEADLDEAVADGVVHVEDSQFGPFADHFNLIMALKTNCTAFKVS